jgi:hypothetical protein
MNPVVQKRKTFFPTVKKSLGSFWGPGSHRDYFTIYRIFKAALKTGRLKRPEKAKAARLLKAALKAAYYLERTDTFIRLFPNDDDENALLIM